MSTVEINSQILKWFDKYHLWEDDERMAELYSVLIDEEVWETLQAIYKGDVVESFDWLWDVYWVCMWAINYYQKLWEDQIVYWYEQWCRLIRKLMWEYFEPVMIEISESNHSKEFWGKAENGKISKWPKFKRPNILRAIWYEDNWDTSRK